LDYSTNSNYPYLFSIVMAVYNVEDYIEEAIKSVINQELDFKSHIQLILVNDGSPDDSKKICERYQKQYPENIVYLEKENGGVSSARNLGLKHVKGKYVNFLDPDDKLSSNTLENVFDFFEKNFNETDIVAIPIIFFDAKTDEHILNYKFTKDRVIDLSKEYDKIQLSSSSAFIKSDVISQYLFNEDMKYAEDAELLNKILIERMKLGVVKSPKYYYRRRVDESSAIQKSLTEKDWFIRYIDTFSVSLLSYVLEKKEDIPHFIQYLIMYDLQWRIKVPEVSVDIMNESERSIFLEKVEHVVAHIDDQIILDQKNINIHYKLYLLKLKYRQQKFDKILQTDNVKLYFKSHLVCSLKEQVITIEFLQIKEGKLFIEGHFGSIFEKDDVKIFVKYRGVKHVVQPVDRKLHAIRSLGITVKDYLGFHVAIPIDGELQKETVTFSCEVSGVEVQVGLNFRVYSNLYSGYNNVYYSCENTLITSPGNLYLVLEKRSLLKHFKMELKFVSELYRSKEIGSKKAILARQIYNVMRTFKKKRVWLFMDRQDKADDNAEHLFKYAIAQNDKVKKYFIIQSNATDFEKLRKLGKGKVISFGGYKHKLLLLLSDKVISSHIDDWVVNPFFSLNKFYQDLITFDTVFLQHGIIKDDLANWLNKFNKNINLFITSSNGEYNSILKGNYGYSEKVVKLTGLPRFDGLVNNNKKQILISPTWRNNIVNKVDQQTGIRPYSDTFKSTNYFKINNMLINDDRVINAAKNKGYSIVFFPHPNIQQQITDFTHNHNVKFAGLGSNYQTLFNESSLLITDYSSIFFDFAYLKKPVIYNHAVPGHYEEGYFNYSDMGFGEVCTSYETLVNTILEYIERDCEMKEVYVQRVEQFYAYTDKGNSKRVYDAILAMNKD